MQPDEPFDEIDAEPTFTYDAEIGGGYWVQIPSAFLRLPKEVYSVEAKVAYAILVGYAGSGATAWPGQDMLSEQVGCSKNTLRIALNELAQHGLISVRRRGQGKPNVYHVYRLNDDLRGSGSRAKSTNQEVQNQGFLKLKNDTSGSSKTALLETQKRPPNKETKNIDSKNQNQGEEGAIGGEAAGAPASSNSSSQNKPSEPKPKGANPAHPPPVPTSSLGVWESAFFEKKKRMHVHKNRGTAEQQAKRAAVTVGTDKFRRVVDLYFSDTDGYYRSRGYPFDLFIRQFESLVAQIEELDEYGSGGAGDGHGGHGGQGGQYGQSGQGGATVARDAAGMGGAAEEGAPDGGRECGGSNGNSGNEPGGRPSGHGNQQRQRRYTDEQLASCAGEGGDAGTAAASPAATPNPSP